MEEEIIRIHRQNLKEVIVTLKILLILGDKSYATRVEKKMLTDLEQTANLLTESLSQPYKKE